MKLIFLFLTLSILSSCGINFHSKAEEKVRIATEIRSKTAEKLKNELDLIPFGFGGQMMDQIEMLKLVFQYRHPIGIEESRKILVQATREFLNEINSNEKILPYLHNYPFEPKNVEILIVLQNQDGTNRDKGNLVLIVIREGIIQYKFDDPCSSTFKVYKESYEEACKIVSI